MIFSVFYMIVMMWRWSW